MAQITKKTNKNGTTSYLIRAFNGRTQSGKVLTKCKTVTPPAGLTPKKEERWVQDEASQFEQQVRNGLLLDSEMLLDDLIDRWFEQYGNKQLKQKTLYDYKLLRPRITAAMGGLKVRDIRPAHIMAFFDNLEEAGIRQDSTYTASPALLKLLPKGKRAKVRQAAGIGEETMRGLCSGKPVSRKTAEKVSSAAGLAFSKAFAEHRKGDGKLSGNSTLHYYAFLSSVFKKGVQWGVIAENPCARAERPKASEIDVQILDEEGIARLMEALEDAPAQLSVIVQLALLTGARRGEICGLRWSDIDLDAGTISINRTVQYISGSGIVFNSPKTRKSKRCLKIGADCVELLREYRQHQITEKLRIGSEWVRKVTLENGKQVTNDLLFTKWNGEPIDPNTVTSWFPGFLEAHNLPAVHFHSLRHSCASLLIAAHAPITTVSQRLGHSQTSTTLNFYASAIQSADAAAADALESVIHVRTRKQA